MKSDSQLHQDVEAKFKSDAILYADKIGVSASNGVVTLTGTVDSYDKKSAAAESAKAVAGVKAVLENIAVTNADDLAEGDGIGDFSRSNPMNF